MFKRFHFQSFESDYDPMEASVTSYLLGISFGGLVFTIIAYLPAKLVNLDIALCTSHYKVKNFEFQL